MLEKKTDAAATAKTAPQKPFWTHRGVRLFAALPFRMVRRKVPFLRRNGLGVELMLYDTNWICNYPADKVSELAYLLWDEEIGVSAHGPIHDLNPGSLDAVIRDYTRHCYLKTLAICQAVGANHVVLHLGMNPLLPESALDKWLESSVHTWAPIIDMAEQLKISIRLENMFIPSPAYMIRLKERLKSDIVKFCFDIGHFHVYSKDPLSHWLNEFGADLAEIHINDNMGTEDEHLALGRGNIDFRRFFRELAARNLNPQFTLEMTSDKFEESLARLSENQWLNHFSDEPA